MKKIHFSVDDTFGCFNWLNYNRKSIKKIFESSTFDFARKIYEKYGIYTHFYCMYTDGKNSLDNISIEWREQFQECNEWMKFGFHCYDGNSNYGLLLNKKIKNDYEKVTNALINIIGSEVCLTDTLRLHYFAGNEFTIRYLKQKGINKLLCADDNRKSYNLSEHADIKLKQTGYYYDEGIGMKFILTDLRIENVKDIEKEITRIKGLSRNNIVIFTHERFLKIEEIRSKLEACFKYL